MPTAASGGGTIANVVCTPSTPVATLASGSAIACTFDLTAPAAGSTAIALTGTASGSNSAGASVTAATTGSVIVATLQAVPTLHFWGLLLMSGLLGLGGALHKRRAG